MFTKMLLVIYVFFQKSWNQVNMSALQQKQILSLRWWQWFWKLHEIDDTGNLDFASELMSHPNSDNDLKITR